MSVYSPWLRKWIVRVQDDGSYLSPSPKPERNAVLARKEFSSLFTEIVRSAPSSHALPEPDQKRFAALWPAGEHAAIERLEKFCRERISNYALHRSQPGLDASSCMSVHLSQGTISARACIRLARASNTSTKLDKGKDGVISWISEVAWRDFYRRKCKHVTPLTLDVLAAWPHVCRNKSYKQDYDRIAWEDNPEEFKAWCEGRTGVPIVDAAMRQLNTVGWMHNRCRMITASFLSKHLLIYWRLGERYFMQHLIDGDFASNNGGWQWCVGSGNDASPWFRIFNPWTQSAKFDPNGDYIRKFIEELEGLDTSKIHVPHEKCDKGELQRRGYPQPIVEHKFARFVGKMKCR
jgi:deoxyribodipyrimidine photo-lyase